MPWLLPPAIKKSQTKTQYKKKIKHHIFQQIAEKVDDDFWKDVFNNLAHNGRYGDFRYIDGALRPNKRNRRNYKIYESLMSM